MKIKKITFFVCVGFILPASVFAQVAITEIMYDLPGTDTGREWIEVSNTGTTDIDLSLWKLYEANSNHKLTPLAGNILSPGSFAIIADSGPKFLIDNPGFTGLLFESAFSLGNSGETIIVRDENLSDIESILIPVEIGAAGDGNSLQKVGSSWIAAVPTPGGETSATESTPVTPPAVDSQTTVSESAAPRSSHSGPAAESPVYEPSELTVTAGRPRLGFVGAPLYFEAKTSSTKNIPLGNAVSSVWSLGDGTQKFGQFIEHTYEFPGEYVVVLNSQSGGASAVSKTTVKIVVPDISIQTVSNGFVEIYNRDVNEFNLGGFVIETAGAHFVVPKDTLIQSHSSIKMPSVTTKLSNPRDYVRVVDRKGRILASTAVERSDFVILFPDGMNLDDFEARLKEISRN